MKYFLRIFVFLFLSSLTKFNCNETIEYKTEKLQSNLATEEMISKAEAQKSKVVAAEKAEKSEKVEKAEKAETLMKKSNKISKVAKTTTTTEKNAGIHEKIKFKRKITVKPQTPLNMDLKLPDVDVYFQGWARYYHYAITNKPHIRKPKLFFQNDRFFHQRIHKPLQKRKDKIGLLAIPNKAAFFMILYNNTLSVFSSRDDTLRRQVDMLSIDLLEPIPEDLIQIGSVKDMGEFPTGSCVEIKAKIPVRIGGEKIINYWYLCFDNPKQKAIFSKTLIKLKIRKQRDVGMVPITVDRLKHKHRLSNQFKPHRKPTKPENKSPANGYWILLQDWTDCTLSCGGGWHYQQWMCIPPKFGGIDCVGDAIRRKPCNTQPCPPAKEILEKKNELKLHLPIVRKPTVNVGRFSGRPQRYSKCLIKENDAFLTEFDKTKKIKKKIPVRIVMNNKTISLFQDDDYSDMLYSYKLENTNYLHSEKFCCFGLRDNEKESNVCGYPENCGDNRDKNEWAKQWKDDYYLFRVLCKTGRQETMLSPSDLDRLNATNPGDPLGLDVDAVHRRKKQLKDEMLDDKDKMYKKNIVQTQEMGFKAIQREFDIENMIKKEEKAKEDADLIDVEDKIKKEEKKAACIHKSIEEKDLDDDWDDKIEADEEMDRLKKKINLKVDAGRQRIKELLAKMRKKAKIRRSGLEQRLQAIRAKMAKEILLNNKEGSIKPCIKGKTNADFRENYCNQNFVEDYINNSSCKNSDDFCYTCCEHEFGNAYRIKRSQCYKVCDGLDKKNLKKKDGNNGGKEGEAWLWAPVNYVKK